MKAYVDNTWAQLKEYLSKMSKGSKIRLAILAVLVIALAIIAAVLLSQTNYVVMYTAQDLVEAGTVADALRDMNVPHVVEGTRILVPEERVSELRAELSMQGVLGPRGLDQTIMDGAAGFAVTDAHARRLYDTQLQDWIRVQITRAQRIEDAIVIVHTGETSPFRAQRGVRPATASVVLTVRGGGRLSRPEAQTIAQIVRAAIPGIQLENITIADENLHYYPIGDAAEDIGTEMTARIVLKDMLEGQLQAQVEQILSPVFGINHLEVTPTVRLNFDRVVTESVRFDPPIAGELGGIARTSHDLWEVHRRDAEAAGIPGTDSNAMGTVEYPYGDLENGLVYETRITERNWEINETREHIVRAQGTIEHLSIAVLLDLNAVEEDYREEIAELVSVGLGINANNVIVQRLPFNNIDDTAEQMRAEMRAREEEARRMELIRMIIMWSVIFLLGLMLILLIRSIFRALNPPPEPEPALAGIGGIDYMAADDYDITDVSEYEEEEIEIKTKPTGLEQIEKFIDKDPVAVAQLLRNWLSDE